MLKIRGDNTQNHDHAMTCVSLSPMNNTVNRPQNPMPPDDEDEDEVDMYLFRVKEGTEKSPPMVQISSARVLTTLATCGSLRAARTNRVIASRAPSALMADKLGAAVVVLTLTATGSS